MILKVSSNLLRSPPSPCHPPSNISFVIFFFFFVQDSPSSVWKPPWTTSPPLWATRPSSSAGFLETHLPPCAGWRTTLLWSRSHAASPTGPRHTDLDCGSATWTQRTRATSSVWPLTWRAPCPPPEFCLSSLVRGLSCWSHSSDSCSVPNGNSLVPILFFRL